MNIKKSKEAFTIIELVVVIAVIGILVLFGLPKLLGYVQKAQLARIMHDVKVMETMMEDELATNLNKNYDSFIDNGKDLGLLIEANRLFEKEGHADNLQYVPMKGEIDGSNHSKYTQLENENSLVNFNNQINLGIGGPAVIESDEEFKEIYQRYKIIPEEYKAKAGTKLKGTFYSNENGKVYYEPDKPIGLQKEKVQLACSIKPEEHGYVFEHITGKIVKYNGTEQHLVIPSYFLVNNECWPVRIIGEAAFMQGNFKSILVPGTVITIERDAFKNLGLKTIRIPGSVKEVKPGAFDGNYEVVYNSPNKVGGLGGYTYIDLNGNSTTIINRTPGVHELGIVFNPNTNTIVKGKEHGEYIPPYINVNGKDIPVKKIAKGAYQGLGLITVELPETLEVIEDYAFAGNQLIGITIPNSVRHIGNYAFAFNEKWKVGNIGGPNRIATIKTIIIKEEEQFDKVNKIGNIMDKNEAKIDLYKSPIVEGKQLGPDVNLLNYIWVTSIDNFVIDVKYGPVGSGEEDIPKGYEMAELEDFRFIATNSAPNEYHGIKGYYQYIGTKEYVVIPHIIQDTELTDYYKMFAGTKVKGVASNNKNITNMAYMFEGLKSETLELKYLNTANVVNMSGMFLSSKLVELDLSTFDTSNVENMINMFRSTKLNTLDLSNFIINKDINMSWMFSDAQATIGYAKNEIAVSRFNNSTGKPAKLIFVIKSNINEIQPDTYIPEEYVLAKNEDFQFTANSSAPNTYNGVKGYYKYIGTDEKVVIPHLIDGNELIDYYRMFAGSKIQGVASDNKNIISMKSMFEGLNSETLELKYLNTSSVKDMGGMFLSSKLIELDLSTFDTSNVKSMVNMFRSTKLNIIDLSSFTINKDINMSWIVLDTQATKGYAKDEVAVSKLNNSTDKPAKLTFIIKDNINKPQPDTHVPTGYKLAKSEDFQFIINKSAPNIYNGVKGYYKYIGTDKKLSFLI